MKKTISLKPEYRLKLGPKDLVSFKVFVAQTERFLNINSKNISMQMTSDRSSTSFENELRIYHFYYKGFITPSNYSKKLYRTKIACSLDLTHCMSTIVNNCPSPIIFDDKKTSSIVGKYTHKLTDLFEVPFTVEKIVPKGLIDRLVSEKKRSQFLVDESPLGNFKGMLDCIDHTILGILKEIPNISEGDKKNIVILVNQFIDLSDWVTCCIENIIQTTYNSMFNPTDTRPIFVIPYEGIGNATENKGRFENVDVSNFSEIFNSELSSLVQSCNLASENFAPYLLKTGLEIGLISLASFVKMIDKDRVSDILKNKVTTKDCLESMEVLSYKLGLEIFEKLGSIKDSIKELLKDITLNSELRKGLYGFLFRVTSIFPSIEWSNKFIYESQNDFVANRTINLANDIRIQSLFAVDSEKMIDDLCHYANESQDYFIQNVLFLSQLATQFKDAEEEGFLNDHIRLLEKSIFIFPLETKPATLFSSLLQLYSDINNDELKLIIKEKLNQNIGPTILEFIDHMSTDKSPSYFSANSFTCTSIVNLVKYFIFEKRFNLVRATAQYLNDHFRNTVSNDKQHSKFIDLLDEINDDYFFTEYEFSQGYSFLDELRFGRVLQLDDSDIPILKKIRPEQILPINDVDETISTPPEVTTMPSGQEQERLSSDVSIILKSSSFETYQKIINFRPFTKQSHVRIRLKELQSLFRSFNTGRLNTTPIEDTQELGLSGKINTPHKTSHRKAQLGTKFYVDGKLKETLISLKPITEKDGYIPDYQIKNIKAIFESLPIKVSCKESVEQSIVSEKEQLAIVMPLHRK